MKAFVRTRLERAIRRVQSAVCGLHGHDALLHFETGRLSLQCTSCGYETPGWDLRSGLPAPPRANTSGRVVRMPIARARRTA